MDVEGVATWGCLQAKLARYIAVDDGGDERYRVSIRTEESYSKEHMVEAVVVTAALNAHP